jgi:uncharacterized damage-inducible protein DinB
VADERIDPELSGGERSMLDAWLDYHRGTLALKCDDLSPEQLRSRSIPTTTLTLLGLVRHMAKVERHWFRKILEGEDVPRLFSTEQDRDADFNDLTSHEPEEVFEIWRDEIARAREICRTRSLDDLSANVDRRGEKFNLRWIITHMIEEYARHNGHADLIREAIDGVTGD